MDKNTLEYSDNQYQLLGVAPQSFEPTIENFLEFVHPEDKHIHLALKARKIVENHDGFITAIGKPTVGSTFTFYLPE